MGSLTALAAVHDATPPTLGAEAGAPGGGTAEDFDGHQALPSALGASVDELAAEAALLAAGL
jgi:hypothetical protein